MLHHHPLLTQLSPHRVVEATFLLTMLGPEAVGSGANSVALACGKSIG